jgi:Prefoldin subunit
MQERWCWCPDAAHCRSRRHLPHPGWCCLCEYSDKNFSRLFVPPHTLSDTHTHTYTHTRADQPLLLPLTPSLYVKGTLANTERVLVNVGTDYFVEVRCIAAATAICGTRVVVETGGPGYTNGGVAEGGPPQQENIDALFGVHTALCCDLMLALNRTCVHNEAHL